MQLEMVEMVYFILNMTQTGSCQVSGYSPFTFSTLDNKFSFRKHYRFKSLYLCIYCLSHFLFPVASLPFVIMNIVSKPYQRGIYCQDESISYPLRQETISHVTLAVVTITFTITIVSPSFIWSPSSLPWSHHPMSHTLILNKVSVHDSAQQRVLLCTTTQRYVLVDLFDIFTTHLTVLIYVASYRMHISKHLPLLFL